MSQVKNKSFTSAKILADSLNSHNGVRLTTMEVEFPRSILAEFNTHGAFSRNAASSRAIPVKKIIDNVTNRCYIPLCWGKNQPGMQSYEIIDDAKEIEVLNSLWLQTRDMCVSEAEKFSNLGVHKQFVNRILEPFFYVKLVVTATDWENFFALRCHHAADPSFQYLADKMLKAYVETEKDPSILIDGQWHLPYFNEEISKMPIEDQIKISVARCARTSYLNFDGKFEPQKDFELHDSLLESGHMSPFEHVAQCAKIPQDKYSGRIRGWKCLRKTFPNENRSIDLVELLENRKKIGFAND